MYLICIILLVIAAVLLAFVVIIQNSKGGGLAAGFDSSNQIMGVRKTTDFLEKTTWGLAIFIVVVSIIATYSSVPSKSSGDTIEGKMIQQSSEDAPIGDPVQ